MNLINGYKVLYEKVENDNRVFYASKDMKLEGADVIDSIAKGTYKLVYQDADHKVRGSVTGIPAETDPFLAINSVFFTEVSLAEAVAPVEEVVETVVETEEETTEEVVEEPVEE